MGRRTKVAALQALALDLAAATRFDEALATVQEALAVAERLRFGTAPPAVADLLQTRAYVLYEAGRLAEAADEAAASARLRRSLGGSDSDQLSRLSDALELQANAFTRLRRLEEADALTDEVVRMRARLPSSERVRAVLNRSAMLFEAGRHEEGLAAAQELLALASERSGGPDLSDPAVVEGLSNLAVLLRFNGRWQEAARAQEVAVEQLRVLAGADAASSHTLASALANLSLLHLERGHPDAAEAPGLEALEIRERLARRVPTRRSELSDSLNNQAAVLGRLGRNHEAEVLAERCVALRRQLHAQQPQAFEVKLANALATHAHTLAASDRPEAGLVAGREAVDRFRDLAAADPVGAGAWLASALDSVAEAASRAGLDDECLAASREAVAVGAGVLVVRRRGFGGTHAEHLFTSAERCRSLPRVGTGECLAWAREAVALLDELATSEPEAYDVLLTRAREVVASLG